MPDSVYVYTDTICVWLWFSYIQIPMTIKFSIAKPTSHQITGGFDASTATKERHIRKVPKNAAPAMVDVQRKNQGGRPPVENPKMAISIRLDRDIIAKLKEGGEGWQSRLNATLRAALGL
ncbi:BrnA antitoxin family protein [Escherichia coli]|uniref:BrnA antitoxin family protein n=1 Tax=Escherichia coli TaxID=562 RepID=UPI003D07E147